MEVKEKMVNIAKSPTKNDAPKAVMDNQLRGTLFVLALIPVLASTWI